MEGGDWDKYESYKREKKNQTDSDRYITESQGFEKLKVKRNSSSDSYRRIEIKEDRNKDDYRK